VRGDNVTNYKPKYISQMLEERGIRPVVNPPQFIAVNTQGRATSPKKKKSSVKKSSTAKLGGTHKKQNSKITGGTLYVLRSPVTGPRLVEQYVSP
jgi:hypothetical protein